MEALHEKLVDSLASALITAAIKGKDAVRIQKSAKKRESTFEGAFLKSLENKLLDNQFKAVSTSFRFIACRSCQKFTISDSTQWKVRPEVEGAIGADVILQWQFKNRTFELLIQIKVLYKKWEDYYYAVRQAEKTKTESGEGVMHNKASHEKAEFIKSEGSKNEIVDEERKHGRAIWGDGPWFNAIYKSKGELAQDAFQAIQMQGYVNDLRKNVGT